MNQNEKLVPFNLMSQFSKLANKYIYYIDINIISDDKMTRHRDPYYFISV